MKIKKMISQSRRDFWADMECEHCGNIEEKVSGYDDQFFHEKVIPDMKCKKCGKKGSEDYKPRTPKYSPHQVV